MEFHEVANIFPMMTDTEFKGLIEDIRKNGLINPIVTYQNKIIDGRNRYLACKELNIEPDYKEWNGKGDMVAYVVGLNLTRRHLNESQRGMVADKIANIPKHQHKSDVSIDLSQEEAAKLMNVSVPTVKRARQVHEHGTPGLVQAVEQGEIKVSTAAIYRKCRENRRRRQTICR